MPAKRGYFLQQAWQLFSINLAMSLLAAIAFIGGQRFELRYWLWGYPALWAITTLVVHALAAIPRHAERYSHLTLIRQAQATARFEQRINPLLVFSFGTWLALVFLWLLIYEDPLSRPALGLTSIPFALVGSALLCSREFALYRYFHRCNQSKVTQERAEVWFETAVADARRSRRQTLHTFTYQNFCAVTHAVCSKTLTFQGYNSFFFAYPFLQTAQDRMAQLRDALVMQRHAVTLPTDDESAQVLVCKLCQSILSCQYLLADVSVPNRNVFFEYGLARGFGRAAWLVSAGAPTRTHPLRTSFFEDTIVVQDEHFKPDEVAAKIAATIAARPRGQPLIEDRLLTPDEYIRSQSRAQRAALVISPRSFLEQCVTPNTMLHVVAGARAELERHGFAVQDNFHEWYGHALDHALTLVRSSRLMIGILASDEYPGQENVNALTSFFLGYALAQGLNVLAFQNLPCQNQMIDIRGLLFQFKDTEDFMVRLQHCLSRVVLAPIPQDYCLPLQ
jgi:hypothetical protein